jgi:hypothetical protein
MHTIRCGKCKRNYVKFIRNLNWKTLNITQDRQCTYNIMLRHVRATIVAVEK